MFSFHQYIDDSPQYIEHDLKKTTFSDGSSLIDLTLHDEMFGDELTIKWDAVNIDKEIIELVHIVEILENKYNIKVQNISLNVPYLPYARADKRFNENQSHGLKIFAGFMKDFKQISTVDIHNVHNAEDLFDNLHAKKNIDIYRGSIFHGSFEYMSFNQLRMIDLIDQKNFMVCAPDSGAAGRAYEFATAAKKYSKNSQIPRSYCEKKRCADTGKITETSIDKDENYENAHILIVDDICDGGATFVHLADKLKEEGAASVSLFVTHMIASKGIKPLEIFNNVYFLNKIGDYF